MPGGQGMSYGAGSGISEAGAKSLRDYARELKAEIEEEAARLVKEKAIPEWDARVIAGDIVRERRTARSTPVEH